MSPRGWDWPPADEADEHGVVGVGADLEPETILSAYRQGLFPMPIQQDGPIAWWSPDPRGVLELSNLHVSRSLQRSIRHFEVRIDENFAETVDGCADPSRPHGWIDGQIRHAFLRLHELGHAHSIEIFDEQGLAGGLYGLSIGGLFAGESMFHHRTDASKAAVVALVEIMDDGGPHRLIDVQWQTDHLSTLGVVAWPRNRYLEALAELTNAQPPTQFR